MTVTWPRWWLLRLPIKGDPDDATGSAGESAADCAACDGAGGGGAGIERERSSEDELSNVQRGGRIVF